MIKLENPVFASPEQLMFIIEGMRNPMNSWDKSDSERCEDKDNCDACLRKIECDNHFISKKELILGPNDVNLMKKLAKAGTDHRKFMRMMPVYVRITAPLYWWSEFDTYKVGTVANSCSKMHRLLEKPFSMNDFSFDQLPGYKYVPDWLVPEVDTDTEQWTKIDDTDYLVSNYGRVQHKGIILGSSHHKDGYMFATIKGVQIPIHRLVATYFLKNPENKPEVNHIDGNKKNNNINNLEWVTQSENQSHAIRNNLQPKKLSTYMGKFTEEEREKIKKLWNSGQYSKRKIAKIYNVSHTCINDIINNKYLYATKENIFKTVAQPYIDTLNELRDEYLRESDIDIKKEIWYSIIQLLPSSYNQTRNVMLNYEVLANIYHSRKNHKLDEWRDFCKWIEEKVPYSWLITEIDKEGYKIIADNGVYVKC